MKKAVVLLLTFTIVLTLLCACGDAAVSESSADTESDESTISEESTVSEISEESTAPDVNAKLIWDDVFADATFKTADDVLKATVYVNGKASSKYDASPASYDVKYVLSGKDYSRVVNYVDGYAVTLPGSDIECDLSLALIRVKYKTDDYCLTVTNESGNPYGNNANGWKTYNDEWLERYLVDNNFISKNNLRRTEAVTTYDDLVEGYEARFYSISINNPGDIEMPYYTIVVLKKPTEYVNFKLFVLKSKQNMSSEMKGVIASYTEINPQGSAVDTQLAYELKMEENWDDTTKAYFEQVMAQTTVDWGFYHYNCVARTSSDYFANRKNITELLTWSSETLGYDMQIYPTYLHIGWGENTTPFPTEQAKEYAGGDGTNGKPVLQCSYQFTTSNNTGLNGYTPMFDILRGKYDDHFRSIAQAIKKYGAPVWFRLNNEMNSDWTSYCGMCTLLDPDIFIATWQRMYDIFIEEGVTNCIFVFNPIAVDTPYGSWSNYLNYYPGSDYCQALGLTSYEMNNTGLTSFKDAYTKVYNKNMPYFKDYPWVIGEFACGGGGDKYYDWGQGKYINTTLGRNSSAQANWITQMFTYFEDLTASKSEFISRLKYAVWFSSNDYADDGKVLNYLDIRGNTAAEEAFRNAFAKIKK